MNTMNSMDRLWQKMDWPIYTTKSMEIAWMSRP